MSNKAINVACNIFACNKHNTRDNFISLIKTLEKVHQCERVESIGCASLRKKKKEECFECWQFSKFTAQPSQLASNNGNLGPLMPISHFPVSVAVPSQRHPNFNSQSGFRSSLRRSGCPSCHVEWRFTWLQLILFPQLCSNANSTLSGCQAPPSLLDSGKAVLWHSSNPIEATKLLIVCRSIPLSVGVKGEGRRGRLNKKLSCKMWKTCWKSLGGPTWTLRNPNNNFNLKCCHWILLWHFNVSVLLECV